LLRKFDVRTSNPVCRFDSSYTTSEKSFKIIIISRNLEEIFPRLQVLCVLSAGSYEVPLPPPPFQPVSFPQNEIGAHSSGIAA
jgi:hypothetical protein